MVNFSQKPPSEYLLRMQQARALDNLVQDALNAHTIGVTESGERVMGKIDSLPCPSCRTKSYAMGSGMPCPHCGCRMRPNVGTIEGETC